MKIENIIEDIIEDITDLKHRLEAQIKTENPQLEFAINLPEIEKLSAIKLIELCLQTGNEHHAYRVEIHTHNGNRVFENRTYRYIDGLLVAEQQRPALYGWFIIVVRDAIKRRKLQKKQDLKGQ